MKCVVGVEVRRYATVTVDVDTEENAADVAAKLVLENPDEADWNEPVVDYCQVHQTIDEVGPESDRAYEERRELAFV